jgi:hypothetical protein
MTDSEFRYWGKVEHVSVTFIEAGPEYEVEPETASEEVTREELEYALDIISRWNVPKKASQRQLTD